MLAVLRDKKEQCQCSLRGRVFSLREEEPQLIKNGVVGHCFVFVDRQHLCWHVVEGEGNGSVGTCALNNDPLLWNDGQRG